MVDKDFNLTFALGLPLKMDRLVIYPVSIGDISNFGYMKFRKYISLFCIDKSKILLFDEKFPDEKSEYDFVTDYLMSSEFKGDILDLLGIILREPMEYQSLYKNFISRNSEKKLVLDKNNYHDFVEYVLIRNKFVEDDTLETKATKKAQEIKRRIAEKQKKIQKSEENKEILSISDLVYILSIGMQIIPSEIKKLDMYQLYECLTRLQIFKDYDLNVQALLHGASKSSIDIIHWMGRPSDDK